MARGVMGIHIAGGQKLQEFHMKHEYEVTFVSNGGNKSTQRTTVFVDGSKGNGPARNEAVRQVESRGNKLIAAVYKKSPSQNS